MFKTLQETVFVFILSLLLLSSPTSGYNHKPNIIFIVADDLGWNDIGWHNREIKTPNLDRLARRGVILNSSYVQPTCTPSRASMLTGVYPFRMGLQHGVIRSKMPQFLPPQYTTLAQQLKDSGYSNHLIGKWHLGFCNWNHTPTEKGFDSFYGFYTGGQDYFKHTRSSYYDFRLNRTVYHPPKDKYSSRLFVDRAIDILEQNKRSENPLFLYLSFQSVHTPLQVPQKYMKLYRKIKNKQRRIYSAMVTAMDDAVGMLTDSLKKNKYLKNTIIVFTTDNGGAAHVAGNNLPLRGSKTTLWEGGTRAVSFVYSKKLLKYPGTVNDGLFHAVDWYPTLLGAAGIKTKGLRIDGVNQWPMIRAGKHSKRKEFVYNINSLTKSYAIRRGDYKLIVGSPGLYSDWYKVRNTPSVCTKFKSLVDEADGDDFFLYDSLNVMARKVKTYLSWFYSKMAGTRIRHYVNLKEKYEKLKRKCKLREHRQNKRFFLPRYLMYNIKEDPTERKNLAGTKWVIFKKMMKRLNYYRHQEAPHQSMTSVARADPRFFGGVWSPGWC